MPSLHLLSCHFIAPLVRGDARYNDLAISLGRDRPVTGLLSEPPAWTLEPADAGVGTWYVCLISAQGALRIQDMMVCCVNFRATTRFHPQPLLRLLILLSKIEHRLCLFRRFSSHQHSRKSFTKNTKHRSSRCRVFVRLFRRVQRGSKLSSGPYEYIRTDAARMQRAERRARLDCNSHKTCSNLHIIHAKICT